MVAPRDLGHDLVVYDRNQRLIAVVEVKNKKNTSPHWAAQLRRNMLAHGRDPVPSEYFFLATPDRVYLWKGEDLVQPPHEIDARSLFAPYFQRAGVSPEGPSPQAFELVVASWLGDLLRFEEPREGLAAVQPGLTDSGFFDAVLGGRLAYAPAA
jgi:hypothetical protein